MPDSPQTIPAKEWILVIDDDPLIQTLLEDLLEGFGCQILLTSNLKDGKQALERCENPAVILCDQKLPDGEGLTFLRELKTTHSHVLRLLITGFPDTQVALAAINDGEIFRFITKPFSPEEVTAAVKEALSRFHLYRENQRLQKELVARNEQLQITNSALQKALNGSVTLCLDVLDRFDHVLASHSLRVAYWAVAMGKSLNLSADQLESLEMAARMHDIGLISVSRSFHPLLHQQQTGWDELPPLEQAALHSHPKTGAELLQFLHHKDVPEIVAAHHEWFDGGGYPNKVAHESIHPLAAILAIPDAYDEMCLAGRNGEVFVQENLGTRFDPEKGRAFLRILSEKSERPDQEREVLISELEPGMKMTCNLFSALGVLLVPKGEVLNPRIIQYIHQHNASAPLTQRIFIAV